MDTRRWFKSAPAILLLCACLPACKKKVPSTVPSPAETTKPRRELLESELIRSIQDWDADEHKKAVLLSAVPLQVARKMQEEKDRQELVLPAPAGWKPENVKQKLKLTLIPEKTMIRKGQRFRYRLEVQNVGQEPIYYSEQGASFIKTDWLSVGQPYAFYVTPPGGAEQKLLSPMILSEGLGKLEEIHFPKSMTTAEKRAAITRMSAEATAAVELSLWLQPGETLISRPDPPLPNRFRDLEAVLKFDRPGTYRIKLVFDDLGDPPDIQEEKQFSLQAKRWGITLQERLKSEERVDRKMGISREQKEKERQKAIRDYEKDKLTAVGRTQSNTVLLEVVP